MTKRKVLLGCTGSVATLKLPELCRKLVECGYDVKVVVTEHARHFFAVEEVPENVDVIGDEEEWAAWKGRGDPVVHIELGKWADVFVIAPLDANTLAKLAMVRIFITLCKLVLIIPTCPFREV